MRKILFILITTILLSGNAYSQEILNSLKKQAFDVADKQLLNLINKVTNKNTSNPTDTSAVKSQPQSHAETWDCTECGAKGNTGKFCRECGTKMPEPVQPWKCSKCGKEGNTGKFCIDCGEKKPEEWKCSECGKTNSGKFCTDCGAKKPEEDKPIEITRDYTEYITSLLPEIPEDWTFNPTLNSETNSTITFTSYQDVLDGILKIPTAKSIITADSMALWSEKQKNVEAALNAMTIKYTSLITELQSAEKKSSGASDDTAKLNITEEDKKEALKQAGIDIESATEAHIEGALAPYLSKKWSIPEEDMVKILKMASTDQSVAAEYIKEHFPEQTSIATNIQMEPISYAMIADSLKQLSQEIEASSALTLEEDLKLLVKDIPSSWKDSEEANNVVQLEQALDDLINKYKNSNSTIETFCKEARKAENTAISSWNMKMAIKWRKAIMEHIDAYKVYIARLSRYESQIEKIRAGRDIDEEYVKVKSQCLSMVSITIKYITIPSAVLYLPQVKYVNEQNK